MRNPFRVLLERYHSLNMRPPIAAAFVGGIIGGMFLLLVTVINLLAGAIQKVPARSSPEQHAPLVSTVATPSLPQQATSADPYEFAHTVIDSLSWAADARQTIVSTEVKGEGTADTLRSMTNARIAINKLERAHDEIQRFANSDNKFVNVAVSLFDIAYRELIVALNESIRADERLVSVSSEQELGALLSETSKWAAQADEAWKALAYATAAATHALVDNTRSTKDGKLAYLTITADQRAELLKELESSFGESVKQGMQAGQHATEAAPAALWQFLNQSWLPADAPAS